MLCAWCWSAEKGLAHAIEGIKGDPVPTAPCANLIPSVNLLWTGSCPGFLSLLRLGHCLSEPGPPRSTYHGPVHTGVGDPVQGQCMELGYRSIPESVHPGSTMASVPTAHRSFPGTSRETSEATRQCHDCILGTDRCLLWCGPDRISFQACAFFRGPGCSGHCC